MLSEAPHEVVIRFSERADARASRSCSREFPREHSAVSWPVRFLSLGCWMGYRAVVEWVKDSPDRAVGVCRIAG
jgi:hypothetical protein